MCIRGDHRISGKVAANEKFIANIRVTRSCFWTFVENRDVAAVVWELMENIHKYEELWLVLVLSLCPCKTVEQANCSMPYKITLFYSKNYSSCLWPITLFVIINPILANYSMFCTIYSFVFQLLFLFCGHLFFACFHSHLQIFAVSEYFRFHFLWYIFLYKNWLFTMYPCYLSMVNYSWLNG